jgi:hypothetical protein
MLNVFFAVNNISDFIIRLCNNTCNTNSSNMQYEQRFVKFNAPFKGTV